MDYHSDDKASEPSPHMNVQLRSFIMYNRSGSAGKCAVTAACTLIEQDASNKFLSNNIELNNTL